MILVTEKDIGLGNTETLKHRLSESVVVVRHIGDFLAPTVGCETFNVESELLHHHIKVKLIVDVVDIG